MPRPGSCTPGKETRYPLYRRLDEPQGRSGRVRKISPTPGFDPRTVQPSSEYLYRMSYPGPPTNVSYHLQCAAFTSQLNVPRGSKLKTQPVGRNAIFHPYLSFLAGWFWVAVLWMRYYSTVRSVSSLARADRIYLTRHPMAVFGALSQIMGKHFGQLTFLFECTTEGTAGT